MNYSPVIGLEIHVQPKTNSKIFCGCDANIFGAEPNTHTCPVCLGFPGALPVPNKKAIEQTVKLALALKCEIAQESKFDRKNYFYPDLAKGYQISQYDEPIGKNGSLTVIFQNPKTDEIEQKLIRIRRVHLEEDTGKLVHEKDSVSGKEYSLVDFNRGGMPLIEIVTEPDIDSPELMKKFLKDLRLIIRYTGISDADMEKGSMRLEPNLSIRHISEGNKLPDYKVELKNINSFRFAEKAVSFEIVRQTKLLEKSEKPVQETRGWNEAKQITVSQRQKEEADDYRYFPEPDIPPLVFTQDWVTSIREELPLQPVEWLEKLTQTYGLTLQQAEVVVEKQEMLNYLVQLSEIVSGDEFTKQAKKIINNPAFMSQTPQELIASSQQEINDTIEDEESLKQIIERLFKEYPHEVEKYKAGKHELLGFFIGQLMAATKGKASPQRGKQLIEKMLLE